ncbi:hypothetical protein Tco_1335716 [Tanacetum coccineum]
MNQKKLPTQKNPNQSTGLYCSHGSLDRLMRRYGKEVADKVKDHRESLDSDDVMMKAFVDQTQRPATGMTEWTIPPNDFPEPEHNWANAYASSFKVPEENKLQRKTYDIGSVFLQYQMDECHKLLTNKVDVSNPEGSGLSAEKVGHRAKVALFIIQAQALVTRLCLKNLFLRVGESEREYDITVRSMASLTGGLGGRNSISTNTLGLKSSTKINLERPNWDEADYYFKEGYRSSLAKSSGMEFIREQVENRVVELYFVETNYQLADILRRIYRSLESFVGGRIRDIDYRLINRTT